jgi:hypothetical protein
MKRYIYGGFFDELSPVMDDTVQSPVDKPDTSASSGGIQDKKEKAKDFVKSNGIVILIVVALILIVVIIIWIISIVRKSNFKVVSISDRIIRLDRSENMPMTFASSKFPPSNGHEFTYSFWIYLTDYDVLYNHRALFRRGGSVDGINFGNPIVALDSKTNKMYIAIKTNQSLDVQSIEDVLMSTKKYAVTAIDYVPLQRWVNIAFTVQDAVITIFMDGDIYSVKSITDIPDIDPVNTSGVITPTRGFYSNTTGDMYVGDSKYITKGFISRLQYMNYACTQKQMQQIYKSGPVKQSILSMIGLSTYGVRAPVYKIDDVE